jgi:hypothetical protein
VTCGDRPHAGRLATIAIFGAMVVLVAPGAALAQGSPTKLALLPLGQAGSFFDLTMTPGETQTLGVEIANDGIAALAARTYAADVYTIINGGFGARLRGQPRSGMTSWLDYPTAVWQLRAGQRLQRAFAVSVPADAGPGEYITSLVLENDQPIHAAGTVAINEFSRQAVAVVVTVPGPRSPVLAIGAASQRLVAGRSVVSVAVANSGNIRLKPLVSFTLSDATGGLVSQASIQMDTFYAHTDTFVEVPLAAALAPGAYTVQLTLDDAAHGARAASGAIPFVVGAPVATAPGAAGAAGLTPVNQPPAGQGVPLGDVVLIAGVLLGVLVLASRSFMWRRRPRVPRET